MSLSTELSSHFRAVVRNLCDNELNARLKNGKPATMKDLASDICIDYQTLENYCNGKAGIPHLEQAALIAKYFEVSLDYLFGNTISNSIPCDKQSVIDYTGLSARAVEILNLYSKVKDSQITDTVDILIRSLEGTATLKSMESDEDEGIDTNKDTDVILNYLNNILSQFNFPAKLTADIRSIYYFTDLSSDSLLYLISVFIHTSDNAGIEIDGEDVNGECVSYNVNDFQPNSPYTNLSTVTDCMGFGFGTDLIKNALITKIVDELRKY